MNEPIWLTVEIVIAIHGEQLRRYGGADGIRDIGMLESAIGRPQNKWAYEAADLADLAAAVAFGLAKNHPFVDGNKRTALLGLVTFLGLNGVSFIVPEAEAVVAIMDLAAGLMSEEAIAHWIRDRAGLVS